MEVEDLQKVSPDLQGNLKSGCESAAIDLVQINRDNIGELPMSGRVLIVQGSIARNRDVDPDYTFRPEPEQTIAILKTLKER